MVGCGPTAIVCRSGRPVRVQAEFQAAIDLCTTEQMLMEVHAKAISSGYHMVRIPGHEVAATTAGEGAAAGSLLGPVGVAKAKESYEKTLQQAMSARTAGPLGVGGAASGSAAGAEVPQAASPAPSGEKTKRSRSSSSSSSSETSEQRRVRRQQKKDRAERHRARQTRNRDRERDRDRDRRRDV